MENIEYLLLGGLGAVAAEVLKLYERKAVLASVRFRKMLKSPIYWVLFVLMVLASGFIAWAAHTGSMVQAWAVVLSGIGASALIRAPPQVAAKKTMLGPGSTLSDIFD